MPNKVEPQTLKPATPEAVAKWIAEMELPQNDKEADMRAKMPAAFKVLVEKATAPDGTPKGRKKALAALAENGFRPPDA